MEQRNGQRKVSRGIAFLEAKHLPVNLVFQTARVAASKMLMPHHTAFLPARIAVSCAYRFAADAFGNPIQRKIDIAGHQLVKAD